jgi:hypothetical protein
MSAMIAEALWYQVVDSHQLPSETLLEQGDILRDCPRFGIERLDRWPPPDDAEVDVATDLVKAVVLTQTCDLVQKKVEWVLLAVVVPWPEARDSMVAQGNQAAKSSKFREALVQGNLPALALLHRHADAPEMSWSVVDFHQLFVLPKALVLDIASSNGARLRLASPYKEHLSQAFARYFMRVGLPHDAKAFVKEGAE